EPTNDSTITINQIEELVYDGEAGGDTLTVSFSDLLIYKPDLYRADAGTFAMGSSLPLQFEQLGPAGTLNAQSMAAGDTLVVAGSQYTDDFSVGPTSVQYRDWLTLNHNLAPDDDLVILGGDPSTGSDEVTVTATAGNDTITVDLQAAIIAGLGTPIDLDGIESLYVEGGGGDDTINLTNLGLPSELDYVELDVAGNSNLNVSGTAGDERIEVTPRAAGSGQLREATDGPPIDYNGFGGVLTVNGGSAGFDVLALLGNDGANVVTTPTATSVTISGGTVTLGTGLDRLDIQTFGGDDSVTLSNGIAIPKIVDLGDGDDTVDASAAAATDPTIYGGAGDDSIVGSPGPDLIFGGSGNDTISGLAGDDTIYGEAGDDRINGGTGADDLIGGADADTFVWTAGDGSDLVEGGTGVDVLDYTATAGADTLTVSASGTRV
ncbi:MAG TPA: calcium-binding protein, partial [Planctomycetaceae bacterium]|nr:calcium-binding protein [Planctomycetaceae bacterium]